MAHWTENSLDDFVSRISFDFVTQLTKRMELLGMTQKDLATKMNLTEGRVSQVLNNPGNLNLETVVKFTRAVGMKVAIVAYDDGDLINERGPIDSEIFAQSWERFNKPTDYWPV